MILEIIYSNLLENIKIIKSFFVDKKIYAVVKSDAYNHGTKEVVPLMIQEGINDYCVSNINEAVELRKLSNDINILLLGRIYKKDVSLYIKNKITVSLSNMIDYELIYDNKLNYQLCINTGMNRYGVSTNESRVILKKKDNFLKGVYTHLGSSEARDKRYYKQCEKFKEVIDSFDISELDIHISSSSDSFDTDNKYNSVRIGMLFYNGVESKLNLLNTIHVGGTIIDIKHVEVNDYVGYYKTNRLRSDELIGVVNIGYEKGVLNCFNIKYVIINSKKYRVIGKICMNNMFVIVDKYVKTGDIVEIFGNYNSIRSISKTSNISAYEILLNLKK